MQRFTHQRFTYKLEAFLFSCIEGLELNRKYLFIPPLALLSSWNRRCPISAKVESLSCLQKLRPEKKKKKLHHFSHIMLIRRPIFKTG
jgi:hypothetical protein